jgi:hypothetical protein
MTKPKQKPQPEPKPIALNDDRALAAVIGAALK